MLRVTLLLSAILPIALILGACQPLQSPSSDLLVLAPEAVSATNATATLETATNAPAQAQAASTRAPNIKTATEHGAMTSRALAGNFLDEPVERGFNVVLPSDFATSATNSLILRSSNGFSSRLYGAGP